MSISFFEQNNSASNSRTPFVETYVETNKPPYKLFPVTCVKRTRKRTGYMLECEAFCVFLFEGSALLSHLLEALNLWIESGQGYQLFVEAQDSDPFYKIGVDQEKQAQWVLTQGKYSWQRPTGSTLEQPPTQNPFLPQTQTITRTRHK